MTRLGDGARHAGKAVTAKHRTDPQTGRWPGLNEKTLRGGIAVSSQPFSPGVSRALQHILARAAPAKPQGTVGRPARPSRPVLDGVLSALRTSCQWKLPDKGWVGVRSSRHQRFQAWRGQGVWAKLLWMAAESGPQ